MLCLFVFFLTKNKSVSLPFQLLQEISHGKIIRVRKASLKKLQVQLLAVHHPE